VGLGTLTALVATPAMAVWAQDMAPRPADEGTVQAGVAPEQRTSDPVVITAN
jgi:hypothetical protein